MNHKNRSFSDFKIRSSEFGLVVIINESRLGRASGKQMKLCQNDGWILWQLCEDTCFLKTAVLVKTDLRLWEQPT